MILLPAPPPSVDTGLRDEDAKPPTAERCDCVVSLPTLLVAVMMNGPLEAGSPYRRIGPLVSTSQWVLAHGADEGFFPSSHARARPHPVASGHTSSAYAVLDDGQCCVAAAHRHAWHYRKLAVRSDTSRGVRTAPGGEPDDKARDAPSKLLTARVSWPKCMARLDGSRLWTRSRWLCRL